MISDKGSYGIAGFLGLLLRQWRVLAMVIVWCLLMLALLPVMLYGELNLAAHIVDGDIHGTASVYACDLDNDGDLDILGASFEENTIDWWRNDGGSPIQWTRQVIATGFYQAGSVFAADLDGDGYRDVIGAARVGDEVAWWDNDGGPLPWTKYVIRSAYDLAHEVYACDLDQDGDQDVLACASLSNEVTWWRNDGGSPPQWTEQAIDTAFLGAKSMHVGDIDADGDLDVAGAAIYSNQVAWWRNDGGDPIQWTEFPIWNTFYGAHRVQVIDIDLDGRLDVLGAGYWANAITWWRNNGGDPVTWTRQIIATGFESACIAQAVDLDGDGDMDVVGTAQTSNQVAWWRNDGGNPIQWTKYVIDNLLQAWPLFCCDVDQDADIDVIAGSSWSGTNEVKWYENQGNAIAEDASGALRPAIGSMIVRGNIALPKGRDCRVFDARGRLVPAAGLPAGIYYLVIDGKVQTRIVKVR